MIARVPADASFHSFFSYFNRFLRSVLTLCKWFVKNASYESDKTNRLIVRQHRAQELSRFCVYAREFSSFDAYRCSRLRMIRSTRTCLPILASLFPVAHPLSSPFILGVCIWSSHVRFNCKVHGEWMGLIKWQKTFANSFTFMWKRNTRNRRDEDFLDQAGSSKICAYVQKQTKEEKKKKKMRFVRWYPEQRENFSLFPYYPGLLRQLWRLRHATI